MEPIIVEQVCLSFSDEKGVVVLSNYNNADQSVISGHVEAVRRASSKLIELGARVTPLKVSAPFHSPLMEPVLGPFREELQKYVFQMPEFAVISNVTARPYQHVGEIIERLTNQIVQPVRWKETMDYLNRNGINTVIELGPKTVLRNLYRKAFPAVMALAVENDFEESIEVLKNAKPHRNLFLSRCMAIAVCSRNANWNDEEYRKGVVEPYKKVQAILESLERDNLQASDEQINEALSMLLSVFATKQTPKEEQSERLEQLFAETGTRKLMKVQFQTSLAGANG
jgi:[acyl-carrier-protein] S-malonyltransferase